MLNAWVSTTDMTLDLLPLQLGQKLIERSHSSTAFSASPSAHDLITMPCQECSLWRWQFHDAGGELHQAAFKITPKSRLS
jgi:hypothetical protein